ncbi:MAG: iron-sulfur cluster assembly accessory protein [Acidimicrobiia bacterium]|jgi:iron-sulfur cluster assembly protein/iron-sulfur cluster insertion protein
MEVEATVMTNDETTTVIPASLSSAAAAKVRELIEAEGDPSMALRLAVRPGGCSGFTYDMYFDTEANATDIVSETDGIRLLVDPESAPLVAGATIDFKDHGLQGSGFSIDNPSQQRSCGCGQSFC